VAGSRSDDLLGIDTVTGAARWNRHVWFSWIESTPAVAAQGPLQRDPSHFEGPLH
jgi:hypothetical protein